MPGRCEAMNRCSPNLRPSPAIERAEFDRRLEQRILGGGGKHVVGLVDRDQDRVAIATQPPPVAEDRERDGGPFARGGEAAGVDHGEPPLVRGGAAGGRPGCSGGRLPVATPQAPVGQAEVLDPTGQRARVVVAQCGLGHIGDRVRVAEPGGDALQPVERVEILDRVEAQQLRLHLRVEVAEVDAQCVRRVVATRSKRRHRLLHRAVPLGFGPGVVRVGERAEHHVIGVGVEHDHVECGAHQQPLEQDPGRVGLS